ncbi:MAG: 1-acyl-sn-glycerol-3-phosphate acyltransferase [Bacteroidales bacterium]
MKVVYAKDFTAISSFFKGEKGHRRAEFIMSLLSIDKVNSLHENYGRYSGPEFTSRLLDDVGVNYLVGNSDRLRDLPEGSFITVSNHPYGGLDGIISIDLIASIRSDYKFMVNETLSRVSALKENFISVTPTGNHKKGITATSIRGIRKSLDHLRRGHPLGFFPSGAVSDFSLRDFRVRDRKWQESILHLIHSVKVPILPMRFFDGNSAFFYFLGLINWRIRLLKLPSEVFNKRGKKVRLGIGNIISVKEQEQFTSAKAFSFFLRKAVYDMPMPSNFLSRKNLNLKKIREDNVTPII